MRNMGITDDIQQANNLTRRHAKLMRKIDPWFLQRYGTPITTCQNNPLLGVLLHGVGPVPRNRAEIDGLMKEYNNLPPIKKGRGHS